MTSARKPPFGLLLLGATLSGSALVVAFAVSNLAAGRAHAVRLAEVQTRNLAQALDMTLSATFQRVDHTLHSVIGELERELAAGRLDRPRLEAFISLQQRLLPEGVAIRVTDLDGRVIFNNPSQDPNANFRDRPYWAPLRDNPQAGLFITRPIMGTFTHRWVVTSARRYVYPDGRFAGVVVVPVEVEHLQEAMAGFDLGAGGMLTLRDTEAGFIARQPPVVKGRSLAIGSREISRELAAVLASGAQQQTYMATAPFDQTRRTLTFRRIRATPMFVVASLAEEDYLVPWRASLRRTVFGLILALAALWGVAGFFWRFWRERERNARAFLESEDRHRTQFELASEGIALISPEGKVVTEFNGAFARMHGYTAEELRNMPLDRLDTPDSYRGVPDRVRRMKAGEPLTFEVEHLRKDGSVLPLEVSASMVLLGGKASILAFHRDISQRKAQEAELRRVNRLYNTLSRMSRGLLQRHTREELFQDVCDTLCATGGFRLAWIGWLDPVTREVHQAAKAGESLPYLEGIRVFASGRPEGKGPTGTCIREDRTYVCQDIASDPAMAPWSARALEFGLRASVAIPIHYQGQAAGAVMAYAREAGVFQDQEVTLLQEASAIITFGLEYLSSEQARRTLEAELHQTQKMESLGSLAGGVAHDMNNVLGAILGLASLQASQAPAGSPLQHNLETIVQACQRGAHLLKGLLGFARKHLAEEKVLDLNQLVKDEVALLERTTLQKVRLVAELAEGLQPIRGDASALSHALMNLCVNAVDAMPGGGTLTLRTANKASDSVVLEVIDTGTGMPKAVLDKALDPFFTTKPQGQGTGLGLSIVYGTVKAHGGRLDIHSQPGLGTRVCIELPAVGPSPETPPLPTVQAPERPARRLQVLLIDDDELIRDSMGALLELLGHQPHIAAGGAEALARLEGGLQPDVVILDMNMPGMDGATTLPRLRALRPDIPVLLATGRADQTALDLVKAHPRVTLAPKPFDVKTLQRLLEAQGY